MAKNKLYYKIGEVAGMLGVDQATIRYWESEFPYLRPNVKKGETRKYKEEDIDKIRYVKTLLKDKKMTIKGAHELIEGNQTYVNNKVEAIRRLRSIREELVTIKKALELSKDRSIQSIISKDLAKDGYL